MEDLLKYEKYNIITKNYNLTEVVTVKTNKKGEEVSSFGEYLLLCDFLEKYGIHIAGSTHIYTAKKEKTKTQVRGCILNKNIPLENIEILDQMYGYKNALVCIALDRNENREYSFWYNTKDKSCELERLEWGSVKFSKKYTSFISMMNEIRSLESIDLLSNPERSIKETRVEYEEIKA